MDASICINCRASSPSLSRCTGCLSVSYCNFSCQRSDWPKHKLVCANLKLQKPLVDPKSVFSLPVQVKVSSLSMLASRRLLDSMEKAAVKLVKDPKEASSYTAVSSFLTLHLQGVQSSSIRQSLLQQTLSGQFPSKSKYRVCQIRNYEVYSAGQDHATDYRDLDRNKLGVTYVKEEVKVNKDILENILEVVGSMICMMISVDIPIIDLGRLHIVEAATGSVVMTNDLNYANKENGESSESEDKNVKNLVMNKAKLLGALTFSLLKCESNLGHPPTFKMAKLDLSTVERFHNCNSVAHGREAQGKRMPMVTQFMSDLDSLVAAFPMTGRTLSALTDLRLGNCLNNLHPTLDEPHVLSRKVLAGVGKCCPSLKVLDLRGSEVDPAILVWLLLADPFITLHKHCYTYYKANNGMTEIMEHKEDCAYCRDPQGREAMEAKKITMENWRIQWCPLSDEVWRLVETNTWRNVNDETDDSEEDEDDCSDSDDSNWETDDEADIKDLCVVDGEVKCQNSDTNDEDETVKLEDDCSQHCGDQIGDWEIDPSDPHYPLINVLSATSLIKCLQQFPTSPCNPLASTLEVLFISGNYMENFLSEAAFPFLLTACPNLKILGDSLAAVKGLRLYNTMEDTCDYVTELREFDLVYPSTYDASGAVLSGMPGHYISITLPKKDNISTLLPYVPVDMVSSKIVKGYPSHGWLNSDNISLLDLYLDKNPLKDITKPLVLGQMVKEDCQLVGRLCPKLTTLKIDLDHPWCVANQTHFWSGLSPLTLTTLQIINGRWENVAPLLKVVGRSLKQVYIILPKRNDAMQGEIDELAQECPLLEHLHLQVGTSPLEIRDLDTFTGFKHLKTVYVGEAFKWDSFLALVSLSPNLEKVQVDKINEQAVGNPPNVTITKDMVDKLSSMVMDNRAGVKVTVLSFSWLDLDKEQLVETLQSLMGVFPALKWLGTLALEEREMGLVKRVVTMAKEDGLVIEILDRVEVRQPGAEF